MSSLANNKAKGRQYENVVSEWFNKTFGFRTERRRLQGVEDRGDLTGTPHLVVECKNEQGWSNALTWIKEANREAINDQKHTKDITLGVVFKRVKGHPSSDDWVVMMDPATFQHFYDAWIEKCESITWDEFYGKA